MNTRVLIADDHPIFRLGLRDLLERNGLVVVAECSDGEQALSAAAKSRPAIALLDVSMPRLNGIDAAQKMERISPFTKKIIMSEHAEEPYVRAALRVGVFGYIVKSESPAAILKAIQETQRDRAYLSPAASRTIVNLCQSECNHIAQRLGPEHVQVIKMIAEGCTTQAMARRLGVSFKRAEYRRICVMKDLDLTKTAQLVRYAVRVGLVSVECHGTRAAAAAAPVGHEPEKAMRAGYGSN